MVRRVAALAAAGVAVAAGVASASAQSYGCSYGAYGNYGYGIDGLWSDFCEPPAPPAQIESPVPAPQQQPLAPPQPVASPPAEGQGYEYSHGYGYAPPMSAEPPAPDTCVCDPDTLLSLVLQADGTFPGNAGGTISSGNADDVKEMVEALFSASPGVLFPSLSGVCECPPEEPVPSPVAALSPPPPVKASPAPKPPPPTPVQTVSPPSPAVPYTKKVIETTVTLGSKEDLALYDVAAALESVRQTMLANFGSGTADGEVAVTVTAVIVVSVSYTVPEGVTCEEMVIAFATSAGIEAALVTTSCFSVLRRALLQDGDSRSAVFAANIPAEDKEAAAGVFDVTTDQVANALGGDVVIEQVGEFGVEIVIETVTQTTSEDIDLSEVNYDAVLSEVIDKVAEESGVVVEVETKVGETEVVLPPPSPAAVSSPPPPAVVDEDDDDGLNGAGAAGIAILVIAVVGGIVFIVVRKNMLASAEGDFDELTTAGEPVAVGGDEAAAMREFAEDMRRV